MKSIHLPLICLLACQVQIAPLYSQIGGIQQDPFKINTGSSIRNLRVSKQSPDGTELTLDMDYAFDGASGPTALLLPVIEKKDHKGASAWFGADPKVVSKGRGLVSIKVKYFNDEPGVPPQLTTDRIRMLLLNNTGRAAILSSPFIKTINWGSADARPAAVPSRRPAGQDKEKLLAEARARDEARVKAEAEAKARAEAETKAKAEAKARGEAQLKAEAEAKAREEARVKAEAEAKRLAESKRLADEKAKTEAKVRDEARLKAETEARVRKEAEDRERADSARREEQRKRAEAEAARLAEEARAAGEKARADAKARETARQKAEAEAKRLAEEKQMAEQKAKAESKAREEARLKAEADVKKQLEESGRKKAEDEARRLAEEKLQAEGKLVAELAAREEARLRAEAVASRLELERLLAEQQEKLELARREEARLKAEGEAQRLAAERQAAEAIANARALAREEERRKAVADAAAREAASLQADADAKAREFAQRAAEAEAKKLAEEKLLAEAKAKTEAEALKLAEAKAKAEGEARALAEAKAKTESEAAARAKAEAESPVAATAAAAAPKPVFTIDPGLKSKIGNVDIINRSQDRSRATIEVEFEYKDNIGSKPAIGISVARDGEPESVQYFDVTPVEFGRAKKASLMIPVKFQPPTGKTQLLGNYGTDQVSVFLADASSTKQHHLFSTAMPLSWRAPGYDPNAAAPAVMASRASPTTTPGTAPAPAPKKATATLEITEYKQTDLYKGYAVVRYTLSSGTAKIRVRLAAASNPSAAAAFDIPHHTVESGSGLELFQIALKKDPNTTVNLVEVDNLEVDIVDESGQVLSTLTQSKTLTWARPQ
jgi:hypothetical protein